MKDQPPGNIEQFLQHHFRRKGLLHKVKVFPYAMYLARSLRDDGSGTFALALQLLYLKASESMGNHDSKVVDADSVD
jgi:hypothetical protein